MFPESQWKPVEFRELRVGVGVTSTVGFDLRSPELGVLLRSNEMEFASVPEASIDEHRDSLACERDVGVAPPVEFEWMIHSKAEAPGVKCASDSQFGPGVAPPVGPHRG